MKIAALFTDYDGTLAPADVRREDSAIPGPLLSVLSKISERIPVAVITSKDLKFVKPRTPFAWAWGTVLGLEVRLRNGSGRQARAPSIFPKVLAGVRKAVPSGIFVEEKRGTDGELLGASLDWTHISAYPPQGVVEAETTFREEGFQVDRYADGTYMDVYAARTDKGQAVNELANLLGVTGPIMYLGDSEADNAAFEACDVAVCVKHAQRVGRLRYEFAVEYQELAKMLSALLRREFEIEEAWFDYLTTRAMVKKFFLRVRKQLEPGAVVKATKEERRA